MIRKYGKTKFPDATKFKPVMSPVKIKSDKQFEQMMRHMEDMRSIDQDMDPKDRSRKLLVKDDNDE